MTKICKLKYLFVGLFGVLIFVLYYTTSKDTDFDLWLSKADSLTKRMNQLRKSLLANFTTQTLKPKRLPVHHLDDRERIRNTIRTVFNRLENFTEFDKSRDYRVIRNLLSPPRRTLPDVPSVTLATQCTSNRLHYLVRISHSWRAPISIAVFAYRDTFVKAVSLVLYFHLCEPLISEFVTFHFAFPVGHLTSNAINNLKAAHENFTCIKSPEMVEENKVLNYGIDEVQYPVNMLRNLAVTKVNTFFVLYIDVDFVPSVNLSSAFMDFISSGGNLTHKAEQKLAYIVPAFEMKQNRAVPQTKSSLLTAWTSGTVRPFHVWTCFQLCHRPTDYDQWRKLPVSGVLEAPYRVEYSPRYEPYFIVHSTQPPFDERFRQYGSNHLSQVCELYVAGYQFPVLNNAFVVHDGFTGRSYAPMHYSWYNEMIKNNILYSHFQEELTRKYPGITRTCS